MKRCLYCGNTLNIYNREKIFTNTNEIETIEKRCDRCGQKFTLKTCKKIRKEFNYEKIN